MEVYGGNIDRKLLESPERKSRTIWKRTLSENKFSSISHMMPRPLPHKLKRALSMSPQRMKEKEREA